MIAKLVTPAADHPMDKLDYQRQNALTVAAILSSIPKRRYRGTVIPIGAVFYIGGTTYVCTEEETITGTASAYIRITVSEDGLTASAAFVADLTGVSWLASASGYYDTSNNLYLFNEYDAYVAGIISQVYFEDTISMLKHGMVEFLESGTFTVPKGVTKVAITGVGGGGPGGNGAAGTNNMYGSGGGSGGSGAWCHRYWITVVPETTYAVTIAQGAASSFGNLVVLPAGGPGGNASGTTPGIAGTAGAATRPFIKAGIAGVAGTAGSYTPSVLTDRGGNGAVGAMSDTPSYTSNGGQAGSGAYPYVSVAAVAGQQSPHRGGGGGGGGGGIDDAAPYQAGAVGGPGSKGRIVVEW